MGRAKLASGSMLTVDDQVALYREQMGKETTERQQALANKVARRCTCTPTSVKRRWEGAEKLTTRRVHHPACEKWKPWMEEARSQTKWDAP